MTSAFPIRTLEESGVILFDCEHKTPPAQVEGFPYIAIPNLRDGRIDLADARRISAEDLTRWTRRVKPVAGDIVVTRRGRVGDSAPIPEDDECAIGQNLVILRSEGEVVRQEYLRWATRGPFWQSEVARMTNVGAVFDSLNCADIPKMRIPVPSQDEQARIASVLRSLDDKIDVNQRIARLLQGEMRLEMESLAGRAARTIGSVASLTRDSVKPSSLPPDTPYIGLEHMPQGDLSLGSHGEAGDITSSKSRFQRGDVLFGKLRPYFKKVGVAQFDGICSSDILVVRPNDDAWRPWLALTLSSDAVIDHATAVSSGTRMPRAKWSDLAGFEAPVPDENVREEWARAANERLNLITALCSENASLSALRDALLPKLLSGELRVDDAQDVVREAAL